MEDVQNKMVFSTIVNKLIEIQKKKKKTHTILRKKKKRIQVLGQINTRRFARITRKSFTWFFFLVKNLCFPSPVVGQTYIYISIHFVVVSPLLPSSPIYVRNKQVVTQHRPRRIISRQRIFKPFCMRPVVRPSGVCGRKKKKKPG